MSPHQLRGAGITHSPAFRGKEHQHQEGGRHPVRGAVLIYPEEIPVMILRQASHFSDLTRTTTSTRRKSKATMDILIKDIEVHLSKDHYRLHMTVREIERQCHSSSP